VRSTLVGGGGGGLWTDMDHGGREHHCHDSSQGSGGDGHGSHGSHGQDRTPCGCDTKCPDISGPCIGLAMTCLYLTTR